MNRGAETWNLTPYFKALVQEINTWGVGEFFLKTLKWSGMSDQQRNRTLFECIRDRCERTAPFSNSHVKDKKFDPATPFILLLKNCSFVTNLCAWVCTMQLLIIHGAAELTKTLQPLKYFNDWEPFQETGSAHNANSGMPSEPEMTCCQDNFGKIWRYSWEPQL